jgi:diguanylate cyclase (GGDEF)-like protein/PAS domain S-box-containing protein
VQQVLDRTIEHYALEKRYLRKDGSVVWARLTVSMHRDAAGNALHLISIIEDIAEKKRAEIALQQAYEELEARVEDRTRMLARANESLVAEVQQRREVEQQLRDNDARLRTILQNSHDAFVAVDAYGRVVEWNRAAESTFGWRRSEAIARPLADLIVPPALRESHEAGMARYTRTREAHVLGRRIELPARHRDGREFPIELTISEVQLGDRRLFTAFLHDISARRAAEARRAETERQLQAITDNSPAMIAYLDADERYRFANAAFLEWYGLDASALLGRTIREFRGDAGYEEIRERIARVLAGQAQTFEREVEGPGGKSRHCQVSYIPDVDEQGRVVGFHAMIYDVSAQKRLARVLEERALRDELTGLPNRAAWKEELTRGLARADRARTGVAVMFLDLDGFKQVNDTYGHEAGDEVLRQFAARLRGSLRASDFIARLSGDEFVVLLDRICDVEGDPPAIAAKILRVMDEPMHVEGRDLRMGASIGIAVQAGPAFDAQSLMRRADEAMYMAKRSPDFRHAVLHC